MLDKVDISSMKRVLKLLLILSFAISSIVLTSCDNSKKDSDNNKVYVCDGPDSKRYHKNKDCWGLDNCSGSIHELSISDAEDDAYTKCKICY